MKCVLSLAVGAMVLAMQTPQPAPYRTAIQQWRKGYEDGLKADRSWLSLAGLFWLKEGETSIGTAPSNGIVLPKGSAPELVGTLKRTGDKVSITFAKDVAALVDGKSVTYAELKPDSQGNPSLVTIHGLSFKVIQRGPRLGIRLYDKNNPALKEFKGASWYPVIRTMRVVAKFVAYDPPKQIAITNVLGDTEMVKCPGYLQFSVKGKNCRLDVQEAGEGYFLNFQDLTSGKTTYPAGRFLDTEKAVDGQVIVDFNKATNPPCAYTPYATCPLPPKGNQLPVEITAGEKTHHSG